MYKVLVIGEILIDSFRNDNDKNIINKIGGAPFNVAYNLASLGVDVTFIGQVGDDDYGEFILNNIKKKPSLNLKINILKNIKTTVAKVISINEDVQYIFERNNTSDYQFDFDELLKIDYSTFDLVHIGSLMLSDDNAYMNLIKLIKRIKTFNTKISFDVNFREDIYLSKDIAFKKNVNLIDYIDVLKTSKSEINWLTQLNSIEEINKKVNTTNRYLFITLGSKGSYLIKDNKIYYEDIYKTDSINFVGCGDSFFAGALFKLINKTSSPKEILKFANATGALTSKVIGALDGYQDENDVIQFINSYKY